MSHLVVSPPLCRRPRSLLRRQPTRARTHASDTKLSESTDQRPTRSMSTGVGPVIQRTSPTYRHIARPRQTNEPAVNRSRADLAVGVLPRVMSFESEAITFEFAISERDRSITGQVIPDSEGHIVLMRTAGEQMQQLDAVGLLHFGDIPTGSVRLRSSATTKPLRQQPSLPCDRCRGLEPVSSDRLTGQRRRRCILGRPPEP